MSLYPIIDTTAMYSFKQTVIKAVKYTVYVGLPFLATMFILSRPEIANLTVLELIQKFVPEQALGLTVGGITLVVLDWLKHKVGLRLP